MTLLKARWRAPAKILGLAAGTLRQGSPADVIVLDPDVPWEPDPAELKSKCKNTPFDEAKLEGRVVRTILAARTVYANVQAGTRAAPYNQTTQGADPAPLPRNNTNKAQ